MSKRVEDFRIQPVTACGVKVWSAATGALMGFCSRERRHRGAHSHLVKAAIIKVR